MAKLFPFRSEDVRSSTEPRLVDIDDNAAEEVFAALSSDTARAILSRLYESPETASGVAEAADTSIQNARYHLEKLEAAGLVEPIDTWYSSRGTEMTVYGPTNEPLVVAAGNEESKGVLRRALERVVGAVAVLALASVVIDRLAGRSGDLFGRIGIEQARDPGNGTGEGPSTSGGNGNGNGNAAEDAGATETEFGTRTPTENDVAMTDGGLPDETTTPARGGTSTNAETQSSVNESFTPSSGTETTIPTPTETATPSPTATATPSPTETPTPIETVTDATTTVADSAVDAASSVPPGALFFAGGLAVIAAGTAWWYWSQYRPMYGA